MGRLKMIHSLLFWLLVLSVMINSDLNVDFLVNSDLNVDALINIDVVMIWLFSIVFGDDSCLVSFNEFLINIFCFPNEFIDCFGVQVKNMVVDYHNVHVD